MRIHLITAAFLSFFAVQPAFAQQINFGDDSGEWAGDVECDDPRFVGAGMTGTDLLVSDLMKDASDCRAQFQAGAIQLRGVANGNISFGDDAGDYANDGECDDMRFIGPAMTSTDLLFDDIMHDATDCHAGYTSGQLTLAGVN